MPRRLRCYVAAPRSLARSVVQIHTMLEDHGIRPMSLWADGVLASASAADPLSDALLDPRRAKWILDDNRKAIAASDVLFAYLPGMVAPDSGAPLEARQQKPPVETYCEIEAARSQGKEIIVFAAAEMIPLSILVALHEGKAIAVTSVINAAFLMSGMSTENLTGEDDPHKDAEETAQRWRLTV